MLHETGQISDKDLDLFREIDSPLQGHPDKLRLPLMDTNRFIRSRVEYHYRTLTWKEIKE